MKTTVFLMNKWFLFYIKTAGDNVFLWVYISNVTLYTAVPVTMFFSGCTYPMSPCKECIFIYCRILCSDKNDYITVRQNAAQIAAQYDSKFCRTVHSDLCSVLLHCRGQDSDSAKCPISATIVYVLFFI